MYRNGNKLMNYDGRIIAERVGNILQVNIWDENNLSGPVKSACIHRDFIIKYAPQIYHYFIRYGSSMLELEDLFPELGDIPCV